MRSSIRSQRFSYSAFQMSVQDCDITDDWPLTADHRVKINNERLAQSACVFFLSRQLSVICRQWSSDLLRLYLSEHPSEKRYNFALPLKRQNARIARTRRGKSLSS